MKKDEGKQYRCGETIDLEEFLNMTGNGPKNTKCKAVVTYASKRTETIYGKLSDDGVPDKAFQKKVSAFRVFPTVTNVEIIKY